MPALKSEKHSFSHYLTSADLLVEETALPQVEDYLARVARQFDAAADTFEAARAEEDFWNPESEYRASLRPYDVKDGVLQLRISGVLLNGFPYQMGSWATGYEYIQKAIERAAADYANGTLKGVAMIVDSPGGIVTGCFECVDAISKTIAQAKLPVRGFAFYACSAAYAVISTADRIDVGRLSEVGSIGVISKHFSYAKYLEKQGIDVTITTSPKGGNKADGQPEVPLSQSAKDRMQKRSDAVYDIFVGVVSKHRGISEEDVRATKASVYLAQAAIDAKLADKLVVLTDAMLGYRQSLNKEKAMGEKNEGGAPAAGSYTKEQLEAAVATATAAGLKAGAEAERTRIQAIVESDDAKGKLASAVALALSSGDLTAASAAAVLKTIDAAAASATSKTGFEKAMETTQNPNAGPGDGQTDKAKDPIQAQIAELIGAHAAVTGEKLERRKH
jgi:ClpP class serine protease